MVTPTQAKVMPHAVTWQAYKWRLQERPVRAGGALASGRSNSSLVDLGEGFRRVARVRLWGIDCGGQKKLVGAGGIWDVRMRFAD